MPTAALPRAQSVLADATGRPTREWYSYFLALRNSDGLTPAQQKQLDDLTARVTALEDGGTGGGSIQGIGSIVTQGSPPGIVQISLEGDTDSPGNTWYYGTAPDGSRGWWALSDGLAVSSGQLTKAVGSDGVTTFGLADLANSGGGALVKITRDAKGRVSGTSSATTNDLAEGSNNLYYTDARVDVRISAQTPLFEGQEFLDAFHRKLISGAMASMLFSGDSTTLGTGIADSQYILSTAVLRIGQGRMHNLTAVNAGHSGASTADWVSNWVASDTATNPDLMVLRWGLNDPYYGRNISQFESSLRSGLSTIRASRSVSQTSIVLMNPSTANDTPNGRDAAWLSATRPVVRQVAKDFQCAFIDTYKLWPTAQGAAGVWMDNPFGDGRAIHPLERMNGWISSAIAELIFPSAFSPTRSSVKATMSSDSVCAPGFNILKLDAEIYDARGEYNPATYQFIPQRSGKYQIGGYAYFAPDTENKSIIVSLFVNGSETVRLSEIPLYGSIAAPPGAGGMSGGMTMIQLAAGDVVSIWVYANSSGNYTIKNYPFTTYFTADRIG